MTNTKVNYATRVGRIMEWAQSKKYCPICKAEECDCWQALAAAPALLEACKVMHNFVDWWLSTSRHDMDVALQGEKGDILIARIKDVRNKALTAITAVEKGA